MRLCEHKINMTDPKYSDLKIKNVDDTFDFMERTYELDADVFPLAIAYALPYICQCDQAVIMTCLAKDGHERSIANYWVGTVGSDQVIYGQLSVSDHCSACPDNCNQSCHVLSEESSVKTSRAYHIVESYPVMKGVRGHIALNSDRPIPNPDLSRWVLSKCSNRIFNQTVAVQDHHVIAGPVGTEADLFIPICAFCKKIRDDAGSWISLEQYFYEKFGYKFTHSICSPCAEDYVKKIS